MALIRSTSSFFGGIQSLARIQQNCAGEQDFNITKSLPSDFTVNGLDWNGLHNTVDIPNPGVKKHASVEVMV